MTPDMIRQLPAGFALVIRGGCAPVIARLPRAGRTRPTGAPAASARPPWDAAAGLPAAEPEPEPGRAGLRAARTWLRGDDTPSYPWS